MSNLVLEERNEDIKRLVGFSENENPQTEVHKASSTLTGIRVNAKWVAGSLIFGVFTFNPQPNWAKLKRKQSTQISEAFQDELLFPRYDWEDDYSKDVSDDEEFLKLDSIIGIANKALEGTILLNDEAALALEDALLADSLDTPSLPNRK